MIKHHGLLLALLLGSVVGAAPARSSGFDDAAAAFDAYADLASAQTTSPARPMGGDQQVSWQAPDGRTINLVVRVPNPAPGAPTVVVPPVPNGADARPYLVAALQQARAQRAGRLVIPHGVYFIKSMDSGNFCHLDLSGLNDLTIDGQGSTLVFSQNKNGLCIDQSHRLQLTNLNIDYSLHMASLGTIQVQNGAKVLVVDANYPVTGADLIGHISEYDRASHNYVLGGQRVYQPASLAYIGGQTYTSPSFKTVSAGKSFIIFHHYYGGAAVLINDYPRPTQSEDISFNHVTLYGAPGMGIVAEGLKRGLGVWNSQVAIRPGNLISTEYDAIHVLYAGGDVSISGNHITGQGDDAINLNGPISPVLNASASGTTFVLGTYAKWIRAGDQLSFFDGDNRFLGVANVVGDPVLISNPQYTVQVDRPIGGVPAKGAIVRDMSLIDSRVAVQNNLIDNCQCHGILVQTPNVLVANNRFNHTSANAIRLLTNVGAFVEGFGAINVKVDNNQINASGVDAGLNLQWAAISAYGAVTNGTSNNPVNKYLDITNNSISNAAQGCVTVMSSEFVRLKNNSCTTTNLPSTGNSEVDALISTGLQMENVKPSVPVQGGVFVDAKSTKHVSTPDQF